MKTGIFGDVHGNYDALEQVLTDLMDKHKVDRYVCLGDIVGYGPDPRKCYEVAVNFTGRASNRFIMGGNHDGYFGTGKFSLASGFAQHTIEYSWTNWLGIKDPRELDSATRVLDEKMVKPVKIQDGRDEDEKPKGWRARVREWNRRRQREKQHILPARNLRDVVRGLSMDKGNREAALEYLKNVGQMERVEEYLLFFRNLAHELVLPGGLMFSHTIPPSLAEYADELGIQRDLIGTAEIYVWSQADYDKEREKAERGGGLDEWKRKNITMDSLIDKVPEGTTLFMAHNHKRGFLKKGNIIIVMTGAVFDRAASEGNPTYDVACYAVHDSETHEVKLDGVKYNRKVVDEKMRTECGFGKFMVRNDG